MLMKMAVVIMSGLSLMNTRMRSGKTVCDMPLRDDRSIFVHRTCNNKKNTHTCRRCFCFIYGRILRHDTHDHI